MADPANGLEAMRGLHADSTGWLADPALWLALALGIAAALAIGYGVQRGILRHWALRRADVSSGCRPRRVLTDEQHAHVPQADHKNLAHSWEGGAAAARPQPGAH